MPSGMCDTLLLVQRFLMILENMRNQSHHNAASHPRWLGTSATPMWEPQIFRLSRWFFLRGPEKWKSLSPTLPTRHRSAVALQMVGYETTSLRYPTWHSDLHRLDSVRSTCLAGVL